MARRPNFLAQMFLSSLGYCDHIRVESARVKTINDVPPSPEFTPASIEQKAARGPVKGKGTRRSRSRSRGRS